MSDRDRPDPSPQTPEHADPERYVELASLDTGYRNLWWNPDFLALTAQRWNTRGATSVLDVGCGTADWGRTVVGHLAPAAALTGVDREPHFLALARKASRADGPPECFVEGEAAALPFADDTFDVVTCQTVLIHVPDAAVAIAEMQRVTKPGGVVLVAEPDNLAGNLALLGGSNATSDQDTLAITALMLACQRGKAALGEGDERVGARLPGLMAAAGLTRVAAHGNDRCISLFPPYASPDMRRSLDQERAWAEQEVSLLIGGRTEAQRLAEAAGAPREVFEEGWAAIARWMADVGGGVDAGRYHATRHFSMVLAGGIKPGAL